MFCIVNLYDIRIGLIEQDRLWYGDYTDKTYCFLCI